MAVCWSRLTQLQSTSRAVSTWMGDRSRDRVAFAPSWPVLSLATPLGRQNEYQRKLPTNTHTRRCTPSVLTAALYNSSSSTFSFSVLISFRSFDWQMSSADRIAYFRFVSAICFTCTMHWNKSISSEANLKQRALAPGWLACYWLCWYRACK